MRLGVGERTTNSDRWDSVRRRVDSLIEERESYYKCAGQMLQG
jgi:hypothetical protein